MTACTVRAAAFVLFMAVHAGRSPGRSRVRIVTSTAPQLVARRELALTPRQLLRVVRGGTSRLVRPVPDKHHHMVRQKVAWPERRRPSTGLRHPRRAG